MLQWNGSLQLQYASNSKENKEKKHIKKKRKNIIPKTILDPLSFSHT